MAGNGRQWPAMAGNGQQWLAMPSHAQQWPNMVERLQKISRPLGGHQAERQSESILCKRSFKVKSTVQEKLKLMAWSFLRGLEASSFEVLLERCKMSAF